MEYLCRGIDTRRVSSGSGSVASCFQEVKYPASKMVDYVHKVEDASQHILIFFSVGCPLADTMGRPGFPDL